MGGSVGGGEAGARRGRGRGATCVHFFPLFPTPGLPRPPYAGPPPKVIWGGGWSRAPVLPCHAAIMPRGVQDPEAADIVHVLEDEKPPFKKPRVETVVCCCLCSPVVVKATALLTPFPLQDEAVAGSICAAAPAAAQAAPESAPKTALVVWIHFDGCGNIQETLFRTTKEFAGQLRRASCRRPSCPPHRRFARMSFDKLSEQHQLLEDGVEHELLDEVDDESKSAYDEHTVIVATC